MFLADASTRWAVRHQPNAMAASRKPNSRRDPLALQPDAGSALRSPW
jgi:hypothetical protein